MDLVLLLLFVVLNVTVAVAANLGCWLLFHRRHSDPFNWRIFLGPKLYREWLYEDTQD